MHKSNVLLHKKKINGKNTYYGDVTKLKQRAVKRPA